MSITAIVATKIFPKTPNSCPSVTHHMHGVNLPAWNSLSPRHLRLSVTVNVIAVVSCSKEIEAACDWFGFPHTLGTRSWLGFMASHWGAA
jgi:hypothetical protein